MIVGYELQVCPHSPVKYAKLNLQQVHKLEIPRAESNGQPYYSIYLFGPYKLAAVAAGCAILFFWVIFPYPITAKSQLQRLLGCSLFVLAKFYSTMHTAVELWLASDLRDVEDAHSPANQLREARQKIFKQEMLLLTGLRMHSHFSAYEPVIGGRFPKQTYDNIMCEVQRILNSMSLMTNTVQNLEGLPS